MKKRNKFGVSRYRYGLFGFFLSSLFMLNNILSTSAWFYPLKKESLPSIGKIYGRISLPGRRKWILLSRFVKLFFSQSSLHIINSFLYQTLHLWRRPIAFGEILPILIISHLSASRFHYTRSSSIFKEKKRIPILALQPWRSPP